MKPTQWIKTALMLLAAIPTVLNAEDDWLEAQEAPVWVAGGSFTAELDLSTKRLSLFPLFGSEQQLSIAVACSNNPELQEGVYLLNLEANQMSFQPSYFQGTAEAQANSMQLLGCQMSAAHTSTRSDILLSDEALKAIRGFDVGAIYVHN
jgi:hypothetical protein